MRATLRLSLACNNRCIFCSQDGLSETPRAGLPPGDELSFVGGEPGLAADLIEQVAVARAAGFRAVGLQTNGLGLAERAAELASAGLTDVQVSLHGAEPAVHDYHTGVAGSFARLTKVASCGSARRASANDFGMRFEVINSSAPIPQTSERGCG